MKDSNVISGPLFDQLIGKLPAKHNPSAPPIAAFDGVQNDNRNGSVGQSNEKAGLNNNYAPPSGGAAPPAYGGAPAANSYPAVEMAEALYIFQGTGATDLPLYQGQRVQVLEKLNADWWRGKDTNTEREGIFPANYVKIIQESRSGPPSTQYGGYSDNSRGTNDNYYPPAQQSQYNNNYYQPPQQQQQQQFPPASTNYYQPPQQQQVAVEPQPAQGGSSSKLQDGAKKFGGKLGNAAIFGAGATIGADIVNSIF